MSEPGAGGRQDLFEPLLNAGRLGDDDIARARELSREEGVPAEEALSRLDLVPEEELAYLLSDGWGLPFMRLAQAAPPARAVEVIGLEKLDRHSMVPVSLRPERLTLAVANPAWVPDLTPLSEFFGCPVRLVVAVRSEIRAALGRIRALMEPASEADERERHDPGTPRTEGRSASAPQGAPASDTELMRVLVRLLVEASRGHVSDVQLMQGGRGLELRCRRDGILEDRVLPMARREQARLVELVKRLSGMDMRDRRLPQNGQMRLPIGDGGDGRDLGLKVACCPILGGERLNIRVLETPERRPGLDDLGLSRGVLRRLRTLLREAAGGLVLVAGPKRSGRTTTLVALLMELPSETRALFSVEETIEQRLPGVCQIHRDVSGAAEGEAPEAASLIDAAADQDADVIMLGDIASPMEAERAVRTAFSGRLVLAGITATDAPSALRLLLERGADPFMLGESLRAVVAQRLVRLLCRDCRRAIYRMPEEVVGLKARLGLEGSTLFDPAGCVACGYRGYAGRTAIHEVLLATPELQEAIAFRSPARDLARAAASSGFRTLAHDGYSKALSGATTVAEVRRVLGAVDLR